jgi:uncharacterized protein YabN with tetrapyrrole methylase and pyrophosphatase domain
MGAEFKNAGSILVRLCARVGCVRGREQTFDIIKWYTLEETCEVLWQQAKTLEGPKL